MELHIGDRAPDLDLPDQHRSRFTLSQFRGDKSVLVVFYPFAFSGVCTGELNGFRDRLGEFETDTSTLLTISCDPVFAQRAFADRDALFFPLLSDFWPHGEVSRGFGVFDEAAGRPNRSSFLVDAEGIVRWSVHSAMGTARDLDAHAEAVRALQPALD
ncbi:peroxiredoxin [Nocardioides mangrovicus]|uniref:Alkyl hydroperoxide reductase E n=1 Tax=Nocardioides mangrovicus TaxID=2478913 RepID=A0A3L8P3M9_9ACTN|nr:peroxiredoxin [Nocardioides mangrovicus]RLV49028.1 peroxiredoxin [Nocardioides mangrovicus]